MTLGIIRVVGIIVFLYLFWRNLKDDYESPKVITLSWLTLLGFLVVGRIGYGLIHFGVWKNFSEWISVWNVPGMSYIGSCLGLFLTSLIYVKKQGWKFFAFMEDSLSAFLVLIGFLLADELVRTKFELINLIYLGIVILAYFLYRFFKGRYRSFVWYKSGKKGFAFLVTTFLIFLGLIGVFLMFKDKIINVVLASIISLLSLIGLFILGDVKKKI